DRTLPRHSPPHRRAPRHPRLLVHAPGGRLGERRARRAALFRLRRSPRHPRPRVRRRHAPAVHAPLHPQAAGDAGAVHRHPPGRLQHPCPGRRGDQRALLERELGGEVSLPVPRVSRGGHGAVLVAPARARVVRVRGGRGAGVRRGVRVRPRPPGPAEAADAGGDGGAGVPGGREAGKGAAAGVPQALPAARQGAAGGAGGGAPPPRERVAPERTGGKHRGARRGRVRERAARPRGGVPGERGRARPVGGGRRPRGRDGPGERLRVRDGLRARRPPRALRRGDVREGLARDGARQAAGRERPRRDAGLGLLERRRGGEAAGAVLRLGEGAGRAPLHRTPAGQVERAGARGAAAGDTVRRAGEAPGLPGRPGGLALPRRSAHRGRPVRRDAPAALRVHPGARGGHHGARGAHALPEARRRERAAGERQRL
ncbi:MAG: hypothetical protein AVDCRST_MAG68-3155, partial [uncultured Gemmatimonadetes bacterium]